MSEINGKSNSMPRGHVKGTSKKCRPASRPNEKTWRGILPVHPAADEFPMMSDAELRELGEDIRQNGLRERIACIDGMLVDGRNRLDAMEMAGFKLVTDKGEMNWALVMPHDVRGVDPYAFLGRTASQPAKNVPSCRSGALTAAPSYGTERSRKMRPRQSPPTFCVRRSRGSKPIQRSLHANAHDDAR